MNKKCSLCDYVGLNFHKGSYYCKPCANAKTRLYHINNIHKESYSRSKRNSWLKRQHGITLQEYEEKLNIQNNECAICKVKLLSSGPLTHLDHDHKTGKLRSFLCTNCNRGLGHFQDSSKLLRKAANYLDSHNQSEDLIKEDIVNDRTH